MSFLSTLLGNPMQGSGTSEPRGYKVTDAGRTRMYGVACRSLQELKRKACAKLGMARDLAEVTVFLPDGSQVDDEYFFTLEPQTTLILRKPGETVLSDADLLYDTLKRVNVNSLMAGLEVPKFSIEILKEKIALLNDVFNVDDSRTACSSRNEHPEWFRGLETHATTKEAYLHRRCQDRIRNYLYKTIEQIRSSEVYSSDHGARCHLLCVIAFFKKQLRKDLYFGFYFDRSYARIKRNKRRWEGPDPFDPSGGCRYDRCRSKPSRRPVARASSASEDSSCKESGEGSARETHHRPWRVPAGRGTSDARERLALCNDRGDFGCAGVWNLDGCSYGDAHRINPYRSREDLILFSTWNLDHKIERSRTLVPNLLKMTKEQDNVSEEAVTDFYDNFFTVKNLRLVHVVCHVKGSHKCFTLLKIMTGAMSLTHADVRNTTTF